MTVQSLMRLCAELGIELTLKGDNNDRLVVDAPKGALTEPLRQALTQHKPALISILRTREQASSRVRNRTSAVVEPSTTPPTTVASQPPVQLSVSEKSQPTSSASIERSEAEVNKLLSGSAYDANVIDANDLTTRDLIGRKLRAALTGSNPEHFDAARRAFLNHGYFEDTTRQLRNAESAADRASAARLLSTVGDQRATPHLATALKDRAAEVRRAAVESLGQLGDGSAIAPLQDLLTRENDPHVPEAVIRHAINSISVTEAKKLPSQPKPAMKPSEETVTSIEAQKGKREIFADYLSAFERQEPVSRVEPPVEASSVSNNLDAGVERLLMEEESLRKAAESLEQRRLEAEAARKLAEDEARIKAEHETKIRMEMEARQREEEEIQRRMLAEAARQKAEVEARARAEQEARLRAEEEARLRAEEEERFRLEAETLRRAAEELAVKRAEAAAERKRAEEAEARRRAEEEARRLAERKREGGRRGLRKRKRNVRQKQKRELVLRQKPDERLRKNSAGE